MLSVWISSKIICASIRYAVNRSFSSLNIKINHYISKFFQSRHLHQIIYKTASLCFICFALSHLCVYGNAWWHLEIASNSYRVSLVGKKNLFYTTWEIYLSLAGNSNIVSEGLFTREQVNFPQKSKLEPVMLKTQPSNQSSYNWEKMRFWHPNPLLLHE